MADATTTKGSSRVVFGEMADHVTERVEPTPEDSETYVGLEHLESGSLTVRRWGTDVALVGTKLRMRKGDILFAKRNAYLRRVAVAPHDGLFSAHGMVLRARPNVVLPEFLPFFMQSDLFMERAKRISVGSISPTINWKTLAKEEFTLPPLAEQRRICHVIATANAAIDALSECSRRCEALIASIRTTQFDPRRYKAMPLAALCGHGEGIQIGPFGAQLHQSDYLADGVPVIMPINMKNDAISTDGIAYVSEEKARSLQVHRIRSGDILLPRRGELDRRAYVSETASGWLCGTGSVRIRVRAEVSSLAVFHALSSPHTVSWLNANAVGSTMPNLNTRIVGDVPIALPPVEKMETVLPALQALGDVLQSLKDRRTLLDETRKRVFANAMGAT